MPCRVLGADSHSLTEVVDLHHLRWLRRVLRMHAHRLPFHALFVRAAQYWQKRRGDQATTWH